MKTSPIFELPPVARHEMHGIEMDLPRDFKGPYYLPLEGDPSGYTFLNVYEWNKDCAETDSDNYFNLAIERVFLLVKCLPAPKISIMRNLLPEFSLISQSERQVDGAPAHCIECSWRNPHGRLVFQRSTWFEKLWSAPPAPYTVTITGTWLHHFSEPWDRGYEAIIDSIKHHAPLPSVLRANHHHGPVR
jgi:hypothetical protein